MQIPGISLVVKCFSQRRWLLPRYGGYTNGGKFNIKSNKCIQKKKRFLVREAEESD